MAQSRSAINAPPVLGGAFCCVLVRGEPYQNKRPASAHKKNVGQPGALTRAPLKSDSSLFIAGSRMG